jgi:RNA polymerase sigma factor (sigma-70 family)
MFFERIAGHLEHVCEFVRHQIAYAEATGDLTPGELTPDEAVDEVLLRAYREFDAEWDEGRLRARLVELARETVAAAVKRSRAWHRRTPARIETDIPDVPPSEWVTTLGEERLEFYEPDEDLKLEDVLPDLEMPTPEDVAATRELRECISAALKALPREWRRAVLLRGVEGLHGTQLAKALGKTPPETHRLLDHARHDLRQRLLEAGCRFKTGNARDPGG